MRRGVVVRPEPYSWQDVCRAIHLSRLGQVPVVIACGEGLTAILPNSAAAVGHRMPVEGRIVTALVRVEAQP
jgi:hypothetical protein